MTKKSHWLRNSIIGSTATLAVLVGVALATVPTHVAVVQHPRDTSVSDNVEQAQLRGTESAFKANQRVIVKAAADKAVADKAVVDKVAPAPNKATKAAAAPKATPKATPKAPPKCYRQCTSDRGLSTLEPGPPGPDGVRRTSPGLNVKEYCGVSTPTYSSVCKP